MDKNVGLCLFMHKYPKLELWLEFGPFHLCSCNDLTTNFFKLISLIYFLPSPLPNPSIQPKQKFSPGCSTPPHKPLTTTTKAYISTHTRWDPKPNTKWTSVIHRIENHNLGSNFDQRLRKRQKIYFLFSGWINSFLSWEAFEPLARLSYNIYLVHMTIMWYFFAKNTHTASLSDLWMVIGHFILFC